MFNDNDIITLAGKPNDAIYSVKNINEFKYELTMLAHDDSEYDKFLGSKILYAAAVVNKYGILVSKAVPWISDIETACHKCHCPKEVWMYQGCKCGGV